MRAELKKISLFLSESGTKKIQLTLAHRSVHGILASTAKFSHCCEILLQNRDYSMVSSMAKETGAFMELSPCQDVDLSLKLLTFKTVAATKN